MIVKKQSKAHVSQRSCSLKSLGRSVGRRNRSSIICRRNRSSIICQVVDSQIRKKVVEHMGKLLSQELTHLSSLKDQFSTAQLLL